MRENTRMESIATAADYADALLVARTARNWIFTALLVMLLAQMGLFFVYRYSHALDPGVTAVTRPAGRDGLTVRSSPSPL